MDHCEVATADDPLAASKAAKTINIPMRCPVVLLFRPPWVETRATNNLVTR
jgi:hypothetical protein